MNLSKLLCFTILIIIIGVGGTMFFYNTFIVKNVDSFDMHVEVANKLGIVADPGAIYFGTLKPGTTSTKKIRIRNVYDHPVNVVIGLHGEMAPWVAIKEPSFRLEPNEWKQAILVTTPPKGTLIGNYSGETKITYKRTV